MLNQEVLVFSSGIGKTFFMYLLLCRWRRQGYRVVDAKTGGVGPTLLCDDGVYDLDQRALATELADPNVRYLPTLLS